MKTFRREIDSILFQVKTSFWAAQPEVIAVIEEYSHFKNAAKTPTHQRRVSLQIFHASRAIDSMLAHIVRHESSKPGRPVAPSQSTLGSSQIYIRDHGVGGQHFVATVDKDSDSIRQDRNRYLHKAALFPSDVDIQKFLLRTANVIAAAIKFSP
jgi:hypothetical protein